MHCQTLPCVVLFIFIESTSALDSGGSWDGGREVSSALTMARRTEDTSKLAVFVLGSKVADVILSERQRVWFERSTRTEGGGESKSTSGRGYSMIRYRIVL